MGRRRWLQLAGAMAMLALVPLVVPPQPASGGVEGWELSLYLVATADDPGGWPIDTAEGRVLRLEDEAIVQGGDITRATRTGDLLTLSLTDDAAQRLQAATATHVGRPLAVVVGDVLLARPIILEAMTGTVVSLDMGL